MCRSLGPTKLRDELAHGPKRVSDVEEAAAKAHIDEQLLAQARGDLGSSPAAAIILAMRSPCS